MDNAELRRLWNNGVKPTWLIFKEVAGDIPIHRKDTTMDRNTAMNKQAETWIKLMEDCDVLGMVIEKLVAVGAVTRAEKPEKPKKPSILDQEWEPDVHGDRTFIQNQNNTAIGQCEPEYAKAISAAPDAFKALKDMVADAKQGETHYKCVVSMASLTEAVDALEKAGIE